MKLYKKILLDINQIDGFVPYESENHCYVAEQDILIEIDLKTNQDGELVESPFVIVKKFNLVIAEERVSTHAASRWHPAETDYIPFETHVYNEEEGYEIELNNDFLGSFDDILADFEGITIDNLKIYL